MLTMLSYFITFTASNDIIIHMTDTMAAYQLVVILHSAGLNSYRW